jgi:hypothetical protein
MLTKAACIKRSDNPHRSNDNRKFMTQVKLVGKNAIEIRER